MVVVDPMKEAGRVAVCVVVSERLMIIIVHAIIYHSRLMPCVSDPSHVVSTNLWHVIGSLSWSCRPHHRNLYAQKEWNPSLLEGFWHLFWALLISFWQIYNRILVAQFFNIMTTFFFWKPIIFFQNRSIRLSYAIRLCDRNKQHSMIISSIHIFFMELSVWYQFCFLTNLWKQVMFSNVYDRRRKERQGARFRHQKGKEWVWYCVFFLNFI